MKSRMLRVCAFVLFLILILPVGLLGCRESISQDPGTDEPSDLPQTSPDAAEPSDGEYVEPTLADHDPTQTYTLPDYAELNMTDYITLGRYRGLTLTLDYDAITVTDEQLDKEIDQLLRENHPDFKVIDRAVEWGDTVVTDYVGTLDGVAFNGGSAVNQTVTLADDNGYIPGFAEGLIGAVPGEPHAANVTFPESYRSTDLAGKTVVFTFTVHYIEGSPALDDDFVTEYTDGEYTDAAVYREAIRRQLADNAYESELHNALWAAISENAAVKQYPIDAVMYYYDYQYKMYQYYAALAELDYETFLAFNGFKPENLFNACKQLVKEDMVYYAVFADGNYTYTDEQYERALDLYTAQNYAALEEQMIAVGREEFSMEEARAYFDRAYSKQLIAQCLEESAFNDLIKDAVIVIEGAPQEDSAS